ncbi:putative F-box domain-containing protein [Helianthus annuus]|nr:putative F-box domain-containing protein [Helianthus annuus]
MSDHIPLEIQLEIIKKLPIKSLIQFRSVSKPWKSTIDSSDFIADYTCSSARLQHLLLISYQNPSSEKIYVPVVDDDMFPQNMVSPTHVPASVNLLRDSIVVGTSHGLVCLFGYYRNPGDFKCGTGMAMSVLWNPLIRKSVAIHVPDVDWPGEPAFGFGVCPATSDPKIVKINEMRTHKKMKGETCSSRWQVEVFSLSSGIWRSSLGSFPCNLVEFDWPHSQVSLDRFIYWFGAGGTEFRLIVSFDLSSEEFGEIYLPVELALHNPMQLFLCKRSDSLAVLKKNIKREQYEVWIPENGVSKLFMKLFTVNMPNEFVHTTSLPLEFRRNGELMMAISDDTDDSEDLVVYEPLSEHINDLGIKGRCDSLVVSSYTESIILLDQ